MPNTCRICRHPQKQAIEDGLLKSVPLRVLAQQTNPMVSAWAIRRHRQHLPAQLAKALNVKESCEPDSLLARVENIFADVKQIAAEAKKAKDWPAATAALREARACLELLGKVTGELQQPGNLHLHQHAHLHAGSVPQSEVEVDIEIARHVQAATLNFDSEEIARLRRLAGSVPTLPS